MTLREYIIDFRHEHGLSQRQFANICGLSNGYIAMIEANENPRTGKPITPSLNSIRKMASAMGLSFRVLADLIESEGANNIDSEDLSEGEKELIAIYRDLTLARRSLLLDLAREIGDIGK